MTDRKKNVSRSQATEVQPQQVQTTAAAKASAREERREQKRETATTKSASKPAARRSSKGSSPVARWRNNRIGRFVYEAYYELRYKVTWPTFEEARNMTIMVLIISVILAVLLSLVDLGLFNLFKVIIGG
ncbi:preprotein translocase subunit SecE [Dictyobacter arantiisoli]|nr:preprotein translocase subunit SecE [Dictyobacter arantiisoli]